MSHGTTSPASSNAQTTSTAIATQPTSCACCVCRCVGGGVRRTLLWRHALAEQGHTHFHGLSKLAVNVECHPPTYTCRPNTMKWAMLDQLQHPPAYFREVIQNHFRCLQEALGFACGARYGTSRTCAEHIGFQKSPKFLPALNSMMPHVLVGACRLRGDYIVENCRKWVAWCREKGQAGE